MLCVMSCAKQNGMVCLVASDGKRSFIFRKENKRSFPSESSILSYLSSFHDESQEEKRKEGDNSDVGSGRNISREQQKDGKGEVSPKNSQ